MSHAKTILGWWFAAEPKLPNGDGRPVVVGEKLTVDGEIVLCKRGLHASRRAIDALQYAPGALVCRVRLSGTIVEDNDKCAASERTVPIAALPGWQNFDGMANCFILVFVRIGVVVEQDLKTWTSSLPMTKR
jgi:hypothetical protein